MHLDQMFCMNPVTSLLAHNMSKVCIQNGIQQLYYVRCIQYSKLNAGIVYSLSAQTGMIVNKLESYTLKIFSECSKHDEIRFVVMNTTGNIWRHHFSSKQTPGHMAGWIQSKMKKKYP